jgi:hypothetical protein
VSRWLALAVLGSTACSSHHAAATVDASDTPDAGLPAAIATGDFPHPLDKTFIRGLQTWLDDAAFETKWQGMLASPIDFLGGADSAFHADLASLATPLPGGLVLCHGDAKLDNFGWTLAGSAAVFSDSDFDDAGQCPAAADALHFLAATDLIFHDAALDEAALAAYVNTVRSPDAAIAIDPATEPDWPTLRKQGVDKDAQNNNSTIKLGGDIVAATPEERAALSALVAGDSRFPANLYDVARELRTTGGSAGFRRYWLLMDEATHPRTILEVKELGTPGTEFGPHQMTYDGPDRMDVLEQFWWQLTAPASNFEVSVLGASFVVRDRYARQNPDATKLTASQALDVTIAEASLLALRHRDAWQGIDPDALEAWLRASAATVTTRWRLAWAQ